MPQFAGQLNSNLVMASMYNMIISQRVFVNNLGKHQTLVDKARVEGSLYGDQKLYTSTDVLKSKPWTGDSEASNLLAIDRPPAPYTQSIVMSVYRQIRVTVDYYLSKQFWMSEGAFDEFQSTILGWLNETKKVYDGTLYNVFIGTSQTSTGKQMRSIDITTAVGTATGAEKARLEGMAIAQDIANLLVEMGDYSRDFNDLQFLRSYGEDQIKVIWNSAYLNKIKKADMPTIFHKEGLVDKLDSEVLPARYFGTVITAANKSNYSASTPAAGKPIDSDDNTYVPGSNHANGCLRAVIEKDVTVGGTDYHVFPGDEIPAGSTIVASGTFELGEVYIEESDVICKVLVELPPIMSAFSVGTVFWNPRSLTENHYLTFGHNALEYFKNYPFITVKAV